MAAVDTWLLRGWVSTSITRRLKEILLMSSWHGTEGTFSVRHTITGQKVVNTVWNMENSNQIESKGFFVSSLLY